MTKENLNQNDIINIKPWTFMRIPKGDFIYGIDLQKIESRHLYKKQRRVENLPYDFWMAKHLVTNEEFSVFPYFTNYKRTRYMNESIERAGQSLPNHPAERNWEDAVAYSNWANEQFRSMIPAGYIIRLPSEMEWEKAARGVNGNLWPWGNQFDSTLCNTENSNIGDTTPVGMYSPKGNSPSGIADMVGNLTDWTLDTGITSSHEYISKGGRYNEKPVSCEDWYTSISDAGGAIRLVISKPIQ